MKSTRTKALDFTRDVKQQIFERDHGLCVLCGSPGFPNAHFIPRSQGGLGIPENGVTLCPRCHDAYDHGVMRKALAIRIMNYLKAVYGDQWDIKNLYYQKWPKEMRL